MKHFEDFMFLGILCSLVIFNNCVAGGEGADCGIFEGCHSDPFPCSVQRQDITIAPNGTLMGYLTEVPIYLNDVIDSADLFVEKLSSADLFDTNSVINHHTIYEFTLTNEFYVSTSFELHQLFNPADTLGSPIDTLSCFTIDSVAPNGLLTTEEDNLLIWENNDVRIELTWVEREFYSCFDLIMKTITLSTGSVKENFLVSDGSARLNLKLLKEDLNYRVCED